MIPANLRASHETLLRAQTLLFGSLGIAGFVTVVGGVVIWSGVYGVNLIIIIVTALTLASLPYLQYRTGSYRVPGAVITVLLVVTMPIYCLLLGAFPVPAVLGFPLVPLMTAFFLGRKVGLVAFREFRNSRFASLTDKGLDFFDLEYDVHAFTSRLPRVRIIPIDEFDPLEFL